MKYESKCPRVCVEKGRVVISLPLTDGGPPAGEETPSAAPLLGRISHAPDFASVRVGDRIYTFTPTQRLMVAALWRAKQEGHEWLSTETLLEAGESNGGKIRDLFRGNPAWGALIASAVAESGAVGTYRLTVTLN